MKRVLGLIFAAGLILPVYAADDKKPETKKVCVKTTDAKTKKEIEKCRDVKIHKKLEGTEIPSKK